MDGRIISQPITYSQSYDSTSKIYTEVFSISKISIDGLNKIVLSDVRQFIATIWKKNASALNPKVAFILDDNLEDRFKNPTTGSFMIGDDLNTFTSITRSMNATDQADNTKRFAYYQIQGNLSNPNLTFQTFSCYSQSYKYKYAFPINLNAVQVLNEYEIDNQYNSKFLYIVPFSSILMETEFMTGGHIQFILRGK